MQASGIHFRGGSDWYIISRQFGQHLTTSHADGLLAGLKKMYNYTLLSGESFFHTVAQNSPYCPTVVWDNRRSENWQGKVGCTCDRPSVDWCGCSPMVYRSNALGNLMENLGQKKFYGRKFDPRIDFRLCGDFDIVLDHFLLTCVPALYRPFSARYDLTPPPPHAPTRRMLCSAWCPC